VGGRERERVGDEHGLDGRRGDSLQRRPRKDAVHGRRFHRSRATREAKISGLEQCTAAGNFIVDDQCNLAGNIPDELPRDRPRIVRVAPFVDDGDREVEPIGVALDVLVLTNVRSNFYLMLGRPPRKVLTNFWSRDQLIYRNPEEALDLRRMQIHREHPVRARRFDQIRHQAGGD